ncbi:S-layer homology domain-containing protein [Lysinibacillus telephonicus]|uniref:S-layer homology domain-containing protein n=1 Tax=Lysinibacillus telephonicus TaxID=1714840 RepID=UPI0031FDAC13
MLDDRLREVEYSDVYSGVDFIDVPKTNQFYPYINKLEWNGIMRGYYLRDDSPIRAFGINQPLTRGQFAGIIVKAYHIPLIKLQSYKENGAVKSDIFDGQKFTYPWGQEIATLETLGILSGYNDGNYKPNTPINRSQFANMLYKVESGNLHFFNQSAIVNEFVKLGIQSDIATEKIKSLKNNDVLNYIASYGDTRYLDTITLAADMRKEGEILFSDINVKIVASKDNRCRKNC